MCTDALQAAGAPLGSDDQGFLVWLGMASNDGWGAKTANKSRLAYEMWCRLADPVYLPEHVIPESPKMPAVRSGVKRQ